MHGEAETSYRVVDTAWHDAMQHWRDGKARHYARTHWEPLQAATQAHLDALRQILELLAAAERATNF